VKRADRSNNTQELAGLNVMLVLESILVLFLGVVNRIMCWGLVKSLRNRYGGVKNVRNGTVVNVHFDLGFFVSLFSLTKFPARWGLLRSRNRVW